MNSVRSLERLMHVCGEINVDAFPVVSYEDFENMENECCFAEDGFIVFLYLNNISGHGDYVDVYIWDCNYFPYTYERFVICNGYCLPEKLESSFLRYIHERYLEIDNGCMTRFCDAVIGTFPEWHFCYYSHIEINKALEHLYYASHRSGVKEILYKAELANIAFNIDMLPHYNMIGTTPSNILNVSFPLRFIRLLNNGMIDELFDEERADFNLKVYKRYSGYFGHNLPNKAQWRYLSELYLNDGKFVGHSFSRTFYNMLSGYDDSLIIENYKTFLQIRNELELWGDFEMPVPDQLPDTIRELRRFRDRCFSANITSKFKIRNKRESYLYTYSNEKYMVLFPKTPLEMCKEAMIQRNCLMNYINMHANRNTTILYIRRCGFPGDPFITIEISNWVIRQVRTRYNEIPDSDALQFVEEYAKAKGLYQPGEYKDLFAPDDLFGYE